MSQINGKTFVITVVASVIISIFIMSTLVLYVPTFQVDLRGPQGEQGLQGEIGPQGVQETVRRRTIPKGFQAGEGCDIIPSEIATEDGVMLGEGASGGPVIASRNDGDYLYRVNHSETVYVLGFRIPWRIGNEVSW